MVQTRNKLSMLSSTSLAYLGSMLAVSLLILILPNRADAFVRSVSKETGKPLYWCMRNIPFIVNESGSKDVGGATFDLVDKSFAAWTAPSCTDLRFENRGETSTSYTGNDGFNLIVWREKSCRSVVRSDDACIVNGNYSHCNNKYNCWGESETAIALTTTTYIPSTGEIVDADIQLNGYNFTFSGVDEITCPESGSCSFSDVENTLVHEIGHLIGLEHAEDPNRDSTMWWQAEYNETKKRTLEQDDINGLCAIYPIGTITTQCGDPSTSVNPKRRQQALVQPVTSCSQSGAFGTFWWCAPLILLAVIARNNRRNSSI